MTYFEDQNFNREIKRYVFDLNRTITIILNKALK